MKKIINVIINVVGVVLMAITWGLTALPALYRLKAISENFIGNFYEIVWRQTNLSVMNVVTFFLFIAVCVFIFVNMFLNKKIHKVTYFVIGALLIVTGVFFLNMGNFYLASNHLDPSTYTVVLGGGLIAMAVLEFVSALLYCVAGLICISDKEPKEVVEK